MKTIRVQGGTHSLTWRSAYRVHLFDDSQQFVRAVLYTYSDNGILLKRRERIQLVQPCGKWEVDLLDKDYGLHVVIFHGPDGMTVEASMQHVVSRVFYPLSQFEPETLIEAVPKVEVNRLIPWPGDCDYWRFVGNCRYIDENNANVLQYIAMRMYYDYPGEDSTLTIYDLNTDSYNDCQGHPEGCHRGKPLPEHGNSVDTAYYTTKGYSHTQKIGTLPVTEIWTDKNDPNATLTDNFDYVRNDAYFNLNNKFIDSKTSVDVRISSELEADVNGDDVPTSMSVNHHLHAHSRKCAIKWKARL